MIRTSRRAFAVPAILALTAGALTAPALADPRGPLVRAGGSLSDLQAAAGPFDGAHAVVQIVASAGGSHTVLRVRGIHGADGQTFGAHLHAGPCVAGDGAAALGHYNTDVIAGDPTPEISEDTEVWLDLEVARIGADVAFGVRVAEGVQARTRVGEEVSKPIAPGRRPCLLCHPR